MSDSEKEKIEGDPTQNEEAPPSSMQHALNHPSEFRLDLGISSLLSELEPKFENDAPYGVVIEKGLAPTSLEQASNPPVVATSENEFEKLARDADWQGLSHFCDARMKSSLGTATALDDSSLGEIEANLWWVKAQLELSEVPTGILSAPLDTVTKILLAASTHSSAPIVRDAEFQRLTKLAAATLEKTAQALSRLSDADSALQFFERAYLMDVKWKGAYVSYARKILENLRSQLKLKSLSPKDKELAREEIALLESRLSKIDVHTISSESKVATSPAKHTEEPSVQTNSVQSSPLQEPASSPFEHSNKCSRPIFMGALISALVACFFWLRAQPSNDGITAEIALAQPSVDIATTLPGAERISRFNNLNALLYDIDRSKDKHSISDMKITTEEAARVKKEQVNTEGPVETPEALNVSSTTPLGNPPAARNTSSSAAANSPTQGREYWILAKTDVLDKPQYTASPVGTLRPGDRVVVEARLGEWLRLHNRNGSPGYILAQNADENPPPGN